jgi:hypothetical protein
VTLTVFGTDRRFFGGRAGSGSAGIPSVPVRERRGLTCPCTALEQRRLQRVPGAVEDDFAGVALTTSYDLRA